MSRHFIAGLSAMFLHTLGRFKSCRIWKIIAECSYKNECLDSNGGCVHTCTNTPGSFQCFCRPGFTANGTTCTDIDECQNDPNNCKDYLQVCTNLSGSYSCACYPTLVGDDKCIRDFEECLENATKTFPPDWTLH